MTKSKEQLSSPKAYRRSFSLAAEDVQAARRLLALMAERQERRPGRADRATLLERARLALDLKQRRVDLLGSDFSAEPPFNMLLALYLGEGTEDTITGARLAELAYLTPSTSLRWLDNLVNNGWIERGLVEEDARKYRLTLTANARLALDRLFAW